MYKVLQDMLLKVLDTKKASADEKLHDSKRKQKKRHCRAGRMVLTCRAVDEEERGLKAVARVCC